MTKLWQFSQSHPIPAFSEKVQRGDEEKFFKDRPKNSPHFKGPTALLPKWHYPLISMQLKCKDWRKLWRKNKLQKSNCTHSILRTMEVRVHGLLAKSLKKCPKTPMRPSTSHFCSASCGRCLNEN